MIPVQHIYLAGKTDAPAYTTGWIGNTFAAPKWVQKDGLGLAVTPDGSCYIGSSWDEARKAGGIYKNGDAVGQLAGIDVAEGAVAADDRYVFLGRPQSVNGRTLNGLGRWRRDGTPAPWDGTGSFLPISSEWASGACLHAGELFVADAASNDVRVFDEETLREKRSFPCQAPFRLTADGSDYLWVLRRQDDDRQGVPADLAEFTLAGSPTGRTISGMNGASAVATDPQGRLLVAGHDGQVLKYDVSHARPRLVGALGIRGGVYAGVPGLMAPNKLLGLWGVGTDAAGNVYTLGRAPAVGGGVDLRAFSPSGKMLWQLVSTQFTDTADVDPATDGRDVYTRDEHFVMDYTKPAGRQWTWKGYTLDPKGDDLRLSWNTNSDMFTWGSPMVRRLQGRLYLYEHPGVQLGIFRKGKGELFVPSGLIDLEPVWAKNAHDARVRYPLGQPLNTRWLWRDVNGDGRIQPDEFQSRPDLTAEIEDVPGSWVDTHGDLWWCGSREGNRCIWHLPLEGFDAHQNPVYDLTDLQRAPIPDEFQDVNRLVYLPGSDVMYLAGTTPVHPRSVGRGLGTEILRYDHWSTPARWVRWRIVLPEDPKNPDSFFPAMSVAGDRLFAVQRYQAHIFMYSAVTGAAIRTISPGPEVGGMTGWCDVENGIQAFRRRNGDYLVFAEDDYRPKIIVYRLAGAKK